MSLVLRQVFVTKLVKDQADLPADFVLPLSDDAHDREDHEHAHGEFHQRSLHE